MPVHTASVITAVLMGPIAYYSNSYELIVIGRSLNGIVRGVRFSLAALCMAEITNRKTLAVYQTPQGWLPLISAAIGNVVAHPQVPVGVDTWPYARASPAILSAIYLLCIPWISPTVTQTIQCEREHQMQSGDNQTNHKDRPSFVLLSKLRHCQGEVLVEEHQNIESEIKADARVEKAPVKKLLSIARYRRQFFVVAVIQASIPLAGTHAILQYANRIFVAAGI